MDLTGRNLKIGRGSIDGLLLFDFLGVTLNNEVYQQRHITIDFPGHKHETFSLICAEAIGYVRPWWQTDVGDRKVLSPIRMGS